MKKKKKLFFIFFGRSYKHSYFTYVITKTNLQYITFVTHFKIHSFHNWFHHPLRGTFFYIGSVMNGLVVGNECIIFKN